MLPAQGRVAVQRRQLAPQLTGRDEQRRVPSQHRLVADLGGAQGIEVAHEMAYLLEPKHSERFVAIMATHDLAWRDARAELTRSGPWMPKFGGNDQMASASRHPTVEANDSLKANRERTSRI